MQILNGCPQAADGLPIGLFHPVFDFFQRRIDSTSFEATAWQLKNIVHLLAASKHMYRQEVGPTGQTAALKPIIGDILGLFIQNSEIAGTHLDGLIQGPNGAYHMIMEVKNEIGARKSDPSVQGAVAYANYWGDGQSKWLRRQCCCPSLIPAVAGPWMCVLGGVLLKNPVIQPLTPFIFVGNNPSSPSHSKFVTKIFASLAKTLSELSRFYQNFEMASIVTNPARHLPYVQYFTRDKCRVEILFKGPVVYGKAVFRAIAQPEEGDQYRIIVKFAESYNAKAHRLLETNNLAPKLIFVSSKATEPFKVAQRVMVVMEEVPHKDLATGARFSDSVQADVSKALKILHDHDIVFGDLRPPNVLVVEDKRGREIGGMLVDFDWCGADGLAKYPIDINTRIRWPKGVYAGMPMYKAHDDYMFTELLNS